METLTGAAVAVLCIQWLVPAQLILHPSTVAAGLENGIEVLVLLMNSVRNTGLPLVKVLVAVAVTLGAGHPSCCDWLVVFTKK